MSWIQVTFRTDADDTGITENFVSSLSSAYWNHPNPSNVVLYRTIPHTGPIRFYIAPEAAALVPDYLLTLQAQECPPPDLQSLMPVLLRGRNLRA